MWTALVVLSTANLLVAAQNLLTTALYDELCVKSESSDGFLFDYDVSEDGCRLSCLILRSSRSRDVVTFVDETFEIVHSERFQNFTCGLAGVNKLYSDCNSI